MGALDAAVRAGKALYVGVSSYSPERTLAAAKILRELGTPMLIHQPSYSMFNRWIEGGLLDALDEVGAGCIAFTALAQGLLTNRYLDGIPADSQTETYAAFRVDIDNRRWAGVPFYLRTGKRLGKRVTEIAVVFKRAPHLPFDDTSTEELGQNAIVIRVQPDEGITMRFGSKVPGNQMEVRDVTMDFGYGSSFAESSPEAYERLILDVLLGDPPLFPQHREVELSWMILDPILDYWAAKHHQPEGYAAGTWGPPSGITMLAQDGFVWRRP